MKKEIYFCVAACLAMVAVFPMDALSGEEEVLRTKEALNVYHESYLPAPNHKAFAQSPTGYFGWYTGRTSVEYAKEDALKACNRYVKNGEACVIINVDGVWVKN